MDFNEYQLFTRTTAIYPKERAIEYVTCGLAEEAGEVAGKRKKSIRDGWSDVRFIDAVTLELGDVLWYLARYADELGVTLESIAKLNVDKLSSRQVRGQLQGSGDNR